MSKKLCIHCNVLRSTDEKDEKDKEGKSFKIITYNYHCSICNAFLYSTDIKIL